MGGGTVDEPVEITTAKDAAGHELVLAFGRLQGAANRLEYILGRSLEQECGISHLMYEVLLILGRADEPGLSMRAIAQEQMLTTGGVTRLVDRMAAAGLVERVEGPGDRRGRLVRLTHKGVETATPPPTRPPARTSTYAWHTTSSCAAATSSASNSSSTQRWSATPCSAESRTPRT
ncbi:MarR family winged helix-turn-helix transcriptional regulator [Streptomyces sp. NBC_01465]|uniref:MarR family winged helix-turn-helix transcriptional regulator n=1 Tax=Streptomyces sp. NBC_01465 TaxID=2903878 RepID=UPI002E367DD3|nr:MarR family transcriptional regulator [Streptomyces sp. NBC_01465]